MSKKTDDLKPVRVEVNKAGGSSVISILHQAISDESLR